MSLTIAINDSTDELANYVTWAPSPLRLALAENAARQVRVRSRTTASGGRIQFRTLDAGPFSDEVELTLPANAAPVTLTVAGEFEHPSSADKDVEVSVVDAQSGQELGRKALMVRIRKNANELSADERDRFLSALVRLNTVASNGLVSFVDILSMHDEVSDPEIHGRSSFLPWHRAFILDLERRLQRVDPSVTLPYWRFDQAAPNVFTRDFMGVPLNDGILDFSSTNPLINWINRLPGSGNQRIRRVNGARVRNALGQWQLVPFDPTQGRAIAVSNGQNDTINLGMPPGSDKHRFLNFADMEGDPHGSAHVSFVGQISAPATAPADPLFFMLHCNVDRLWARWQWLADRWTTGQEDSYPLVGQGDPQFGGPGGIGDFTLDTMWPWNGVDTAPRPNTAPGGPFVSLYNAGPTSQPTVGEMLDYQGQVSGGIGLGFGYSDIPFEH